MSGPLPAALPQLPGFVRFRLAGNQLEGEIPSPYTELSVGALDLRNNDFASVENDLSDELNLSQIGMASWDSLQRVVAVYPQLALGGGFEIMVTVSSRSSSPWNGRVYLNGGNWPTDRRWEMNGIDMTGLSSFPVGLEPQGSQQITLSSSGPAVDGWLSIVASADSDSQDVAPAFFYNLSGESGLVDSTGVGPAELSDGFYFPVQQSSTGQTILTGIAIRSIVGPITVTVIDEQGNPVASTIVFQEQALLLSELFPDLPSDFVGTLLLQTNFGPFFVTVLRVEVTESNGVQLTSIPATVLQPF